LTSNASPAQPSAKELYDESAFKELDRIEKKITEIKSAYNCGQVTEAYAKEWEARELREHENNMTALQQKFPNSVSVDVQNTYVGVSQNSTASMPNAGRSQDQEYCGYEEFE